METELVEKPKLVEKHKTELEEKKKQKLITQKSNAKQWASKFEDYLHEYYYEFVNPTCLDDNLPDSTSDWIGELDAQEIIELAGIFIARKVLK